MKTFAKEFVWATVGNMPGAVFVVSTLVGFGLYCLLGGERFTAFLWWMLGGK